MILTNVNLDDTNGQEDFLQMEQAASTYLKNEQAYVATVQPQLADGSSTELVLENPTTDTDVFVIQASVIGAGYAPISVRVGRSIDTAGNNETVDNLVFGSSESTSMNVDAGGTYSGGSLNANAQLHGGSGTLGGGVSYQEWESPPAIIPAGSSGSIELTNQTGGTEEYTISLIYAEVPA